MQPPVNEQLLDVFQKAVRDAFGFYARRLDVHLIEVCPWMFGFTYRSVQVTAGIYHGHRPSMMVKLRPDLTPAPLGTDDEFMMVLDWVEAFVTGKSFAPNMGSFRTSETMKSEVARMAGQFGTFAMPLLRSSQIDWTAIHSFIRDSIEARKMSEQQAQDRLDAAVRTLEANLELIDPILHNFCAANGFSSMSHAGCWPRRKVWAREDVDRSLDLTMDWSPPEFMERGFDPGIPWSLLATASLMEPPPGRILSTYVFRALPFSRIPKILAENLVEGLVRLRGTSRADILNKGRPW